MDRIHSLRVGWMNFQTGVSCFSKTLFYFILLALTKETALELRYILKNNETFSNLSVAIVSQKNWEFSMQIENRK